MVRCLDTAATAALKQQWIKIATNAFNVGGLLGTLLTIPFAKRFGRRTMYKVYFVAASAALFATFGLDMPAETRLYLYFLIGLAIFGVFGSFTFYLPELFPTRLRSTGAGFCYNIGRVVTAGGVFAVIAAGKGNPTVFLRAHLAIAVVPLIALFCMRWVVETRGEVMPD